MKTSKQIVRQQSSSNNSISRNSNMSNQSSSNKVLMSSYELASKAAGYNLAAANAARKGR
jgi:hypothetical protein